MSRTEMATFWRAIERGIFRLADHRSPEMLCSVANVLFGEATLQRRQARQTAALGR